MNIIEKALTNEAYGFPRGAERRVDPVALACIHITGNKATASMTDPVAAAMAERNYANRSGSNGPSAHFYVARNGTAIHAINAVKYAAWSNGDVNSPNTDNKGIQRVLDFRGKHYNINEAYWLEIENVGDGPSGHPVNAAQKQFCAEIIAATAKRTGLPINRQTVHGHWEINGIDRWTCPCPGSRHESFLNDIIAAANLIVNPPAAEPDPEPVDTTPYSEADLAAAIDKAVAAVSATLNTEITRLTDLLKLADADDAAVAAQLRTLADQLAA